jgi:hypothetical protein
VKPNYPESIEELWKHVEGKINRNHARYKLLFIYILVQIQKIGVFPIVPLFEITGKKVRKGVGQSGICFHSNC